MKYSNIPAALHSFTFRCRVSWPLHYHPLLPHSILFGKDSAFSSLQGIIEFRQLSNLCMSCLQGPCQQQERPHVALWTRPWNGPWHFMFLVMVLKHIMSLKWLHWSYKSVCLHDLFLNIFDVSIQNPLSHWELHWPPPPPIDSVDLLSLFLILIIYNYLTYSLLLFLCYCLYPPLAWTAEDHKDGNCFSILSTQCIFIPHRFI